MLVLFVLTFSTVIGRFCLEPVRCGVVTDQDTQEGGAELRSTDLTKQKQSVDTRYRKQPLKSVERWGCFPVEGVLEPLWGMSLAVSPYQLSFSLVYGRLIAFPWRMVGRCGNYIYFRNM